MPLIVITIKSVSYHYLNSGVSMTTIVEKTNWCVHRVMGAGIAIFTFTILLCTHIIGHAFLFIGENIIKFNDFVMDKIEKL